MRDLVDTTEMYLRTIYELEEEGIPPLRARIAERLEQSGPTVSQTVARMERDGLLSVEKDRSLKLSAEGRALATAVMRKHRLAERLLTDVIGLPWDKVHDEACRWEHVMSDEVEQRLVEVLDEHDTSPFGNPIPGLNFLTEQAADSTDFSQTAVAEDPNSVRAADLAAGEEHEAVVASFNEIVQVEGSLMNRLRKAGILPGVTVTVIPAEDHLILRSGSAEVAIPSELAHAVRVRSVSDV